MYNQRLMALNEQNFIVSSIVSQLMPSENIETEIIDKFQKFYGEKYE